MERCGLALNIAKCKFGQPTVTFLRHHVSAGGKVGGYHLPPQPSTIKELLRYLGMVNYCSRFLPAAAKVLKPSSPESHFQYSGSQWPDQSTEVLLCPASGGFWGMKKAW